MCDGVVVCFLCCNVSEADVFFGVRREKRARWGGRKEEMYIFSGSKKKYASGNEHPA